MIMFTQFYQQLDIYLGVESQLQQLPVTSG